MDGMTVFMRGKLTYLKGICFRFWMGWHMDGGQSLRGRVFIGTKGICFHFGMGRLMDGIVYRGEGKEQGVKVGVGGKGREQGEKEGDRGNGKERG